MDSLCSLHLEDGNELSLTPPNTIVNYNVMNIDKQSATKLIVTQGNIDLLPSPMQFIQIGSINLKRPANTYSEYFFQSTAYTENRFGENILPCLTSFSIIPTLTSTK